MALHPGGSDRGPEVLRSVAANVLTGVSRTLAFTSRTLEQVASAVRGADQGPGRDEPVATDDVIDEVADQAAALDDAVEDQPETATPVDLAPPVPPPTEPVPEGPAHSRTAETHEAELADGTADEVIAQVPTLSTDELRRLYEYESANKRRKTVLTAIERALSPS